MESQPGETEIERLHACQPRHTIDKDDLHKSFEVSNGLAPINKQDAEPIPEARRVKVTRFNIDLNMRKACQRIRKRRFLKSIL
jgi:hypothetical protein